jgi:hypothetical protein
MKKQYIYFATNDEKKAHLVKSFLDEEFLNYYNCKLISKKYDSIYGFWEELNALSITEQSDTLVIFDPAIYNNIPITIANNIDEQTTKSTNYWHDIKTIELYPWYRLILTYPLITTIFLTINKKLFDGIDIDPFCYIDLTSDIKKQFVDNIELFLSGIRGWFDPFGLREYWRKKVLTDMFQITKNDEQKDVSINLKPFFCIEDEIEYALFNAYATYKMGADVLIVNTYKTLKWAREKAKCLEKVNIIRDLDIYFPDHPRDRESRNSLQKLDELFPNIKDDKISDIIVSSDEHKATIKKPIKNMFQITKELNLKENKRISKKAYCINNNNEDKNRHAAPYLNMEMVKDLLSQADSATDEYSNKVFKSLLYMEAYILLCGMAPTASMDILKNLHLAELNFELLFMGIDKNQKIKDRKEDIKNDIDNLLNSKNDLKNSFLISFWNDARIVYKNNEQFDAAEEANMETMKLIKWF